MIINSINNVTTLRNYTTVKNNQQQNTIKNTGVQNKDLLSYPKNYRPSFGLFSKKANNIENTKTEQDELLYKRIEEEIRKSEIEEISIKYHLPFYEAEKLYNGFLKIAFIEPQYNDDEIGSNSIIGHDKEKCKLASDFIATNNR